MLLPNHGANPEALLKALQMDVTNSHIDYSVNTNPFGLPKIIVEQWESYQELISLYPDPTCSQLKEKIASYNQVKKEQILVGNGAAELIFLLASHFQRKKVLIVEPTFSEYRDACHSFECTVDHVILSRENDWQLEVDQLIEKIRTNQYVALFLCHPNNPTGCMYHREDLLSIIREADHFGVTVIIDEAFYDFCTETITVAPYIKEFSNLVVLRSLTKMYSIAGVRLGYALMNEDFATKLASRQHPWNINGIAQAIGVTVFSDDSFAKDTATKIANERNRLFQQLTTIGYDVSPSVVNYYLLKETEKNVDLLPFMKYLIKNGIIPRHTYNFIGLDGKYLRLTIKEKEQNDQLLSVLKGWKETCSTSLVVE